MFSGVLIRHWSNRDNGLKLLASFSMILQNCGSKFKSDVGQLKPKDKWSQVQSKFCLCMLKPSVLYTFQMNFLGIGTNASVPEPYGISGRLLTFSSLKTKICNEKKNWNCRE